LDIIKKIVPGAGSSGRCRFKLKCIVCGHELTGEEKNCPNCGTSLDLMFTKTCPKCGYENLWSADRCEQCGKDISCVPPTGYEMKGGKKHKGKNKIVYRCPMCGFEADYPFETCPVCGQKLVY